MDWLAPLAVYHNPGSNRAPYCQFRLGKVTETASTSIDASQKKLTKPQSSKAYGLQDRPRHAALENGSPANGAHRWTATTPGPSSKNWNASA